MKRILAIEDEADLAMYLRMVLEDNGYEVTVAGTAADALSRLTGQAVDLITLDLTLPDRPGRDLFVEIRTGKHKAIPVVIVSGLDLDGKEYGEVLAYLIDQTGGGPEASLEKPINPPALVETIRGLIGA